jgi:glycine/serine hydroxymethyltransferase
VAIDREVLLQSLAQQRLELGSSVVLTPVDSLPFMLADREHTGFLHGLYLTDKIRDLQASQDALILFGGREAAGRDITAIHRLLAEALGGTDSSLRLLAGLQAHTAIFMSISHIGQTVMLLPEAAGGHFSSHAILKRLGLQTVDIPLDYNRLCVDRTGALELIAHRRPDFVFIDRSEGLRYEDFSFLGNLEDQVTIFDASQYLTQIITGRYSNPFDWGFDLMLFSLHKSFPGPQKAGVVGREPGDLWNRLVKGLGTLVSSSHAENTYLAGLTLLRREWLETFASRLLATATLLELELGHRGVPVVERSLQGDQSWPATHHIWIRYRDKREAFAQFQKLNSVGILTNYRKLPYDLGFGLRLGTTHSSVAGLAEDEMVDLAEIIAHTVAGGDSRELRRKVKALAHAASTGAILPSPYWLTNG